MNIIRKYKMRSLGIELSTDENDLLIFIESVFHNLKQTKISSRSDSIFFVKDNMCYLEYNKPYNHYFSGTKIIIVL